MPSSRPHRRKAALRIRHEAGYAFLEAMPPLIACGFFGTVIATGLMIQSPPTAGEAIHSEPRQHFSASEETIPHPGGELGYRPTPESATSRYAYATRDYEDRLAALGTRSGTQFHGTPSTDFNGDGAEDLLITKPRVTNLLDGTDPTGGFGSVEVWFKWSATAELTLTGPIQNDLFGLSAKSAGDLDGDGADDIVVGGMLDHGDSGLEGAVYVYSGSDGTLLLSIIGEEWEYLGRTVAGASDVDGDGQWDIAASSWVYEDYKAKGMVSLFDGSDGSLIRTFTTDLYNDGFGYEVVSLGDLDGDSRSEIAVSASLAPGDPRAFAPATGRLHIFSGIARDTEPDHLDTSNAALTIYNPDPLVDHFAVAVELTPDRDDDGIADLLVTSLIDPYEASLKTTTLQVFSSVTGNLLWPVQATAPGSGRDDETLPSEDENGNIIHYAHYTTGLGVQGDSTRDLKVELEDLTLVTNYIGNPAEPGNPVSGDLSMSGSVDLSDLNIVIGSLNDQSVFLDFTEDPSRLMARWSALDPYQYGDYVTGAPGREGGGPRTGEPSPSDPAYPWPDPHFPGIHVTATPIAAGTGTAPCKGFINHPGCGFSPDCISRCCGQPDCSPTDPAAGGGGGIVDTNGNGIPDGVDCATGGMPVRTALCPYPCADDDGDGVPNQLDCDSPCFDDRYSPTGSGGVSCVPCEDDDCDGITNQNDCDSACYKGNPFEDCACRDDDQDGIKNQDDPDSPCFESGWQFDLDIDSDNDDGIDLPSRSDSEDGLEDDEDADNKLIPINAIDADIDGIVDYADGFNLNGIEGDGDDVIDPDNNDGVGFTPLVLQLKATPECAEGMTIRIIYSASDPNLVTFDTNGNPELPAGGLIRIWTKDAMEARSPRSISDEDKPGDYVEPGYHQVENFEFNDQGIAILYVEAVAIDDLGPSVPIRAVLSGHGGQPMAISDTVRLRTFELQSVIFDELTGEVEPAPVILEPADLQPELWLTSVNAKLLSYSTMEITVEGVVRDRLSELTLNPEQQLESLRFYVEGHLVHELVDLPSLTVTTPIAPWQLSTLEVPFSVTFEYDAPTGHFGAGGVPIDVMTSINAAGQNNRVSTFVGVNWLDIDWITGESLSPLPGFVGGRTPLTLDFPNRVGSEPGTNAVISLSYNGTTAGTTLSVGSGGLGTYEGDFTVLGMTSGIAFSAVGDRLLDPNEPDVIFFDAAYSDLDGEPRTHRLMFTETGDDTAQFVQELLRDFELSFSGSSSTTGDTASVRYAGGNGPWTELLEPDGVLDSPSLHGDPAHLGYNGEDLRLDIGENITLNPSAEDVLDAPLYLSSGAGEVAIATQWVETGANTRIFRASSGGLINHPDRIPWAIRNTPYESGGFIPVIGYLPEFTEPDEESFPSLNRIVKRISGLGDNVDPSMLGISDTFDVEPVEAHAYSPYRYYSIRIKNNNQIAVYFFTAETLPPGLDEARLKTGFDSSVHETFMRVRPSDRDTYKLKIIRATANNLGQLENAPHPVSEDQEITVDSIFDWYMFLLNEDGPGVQDKNAALELLTSYSAQGGVIRIENIDQIWWHLSDRKLEIDLSPAGGHTAIIRIDPRHVDDPAEAAGLLHEALIKVVEDMNFPLISGAEIGTFKSLLKSRWDRVLGTVSAGANLYIEGVTLFLPGTDWGLFINDAIEGDIGWEAAINFLPFAKAALNNKSTRNRIRICTSASMRSARDCNGFAFDENLCDKIDKAKDKSSYTDRLNDLFNELPAMHYEERSRLVKEIISPPMKRDKRLKSEMAVAVNRSVTDYHAHHIYPFNYRSRFLVWGIDVDDYRNGQGVFLHKNIHKNNSNWHTLYNTAWELELNRVDALAKLGEINFEEGKQMLVNFRDTDAMPRILEQISLSKVKTPAIWP